MRLLKSKAIAIIVITILFFLIFSNSSFAYVNQKSINSRFIKGFKIENIDGRIFFYKSPDVEMPEEGYPVIFLFHGAVQHGFSWFIGLDLWSYRQTQFTRKSIDKGFFVIAPSSLKPIRPGPRAWDVFSNESKDLIFMENMFDWIESHDDILDDNNIFCAGFSSGAFMCSRVGHVFGNKIKSIAVHSGANADSIYLTDGPPAFDLDKNYNFSKDFPPTIIIHGEKDGFVPVEAANLFYSDLQRCGIISEKHIYSEKGHIWFSDYEDLIFDFFNK